MRLCEIAKEYRKAEAIIKVRLAELRKRCRETHDSEEKWRLTQQIKTLTGIYTQVREIAELCERYYDRGYWRNGKYRT